ncbi:MAG: hypothetical protein EKK64_06370 [Neisseriaceae bacterium]|jgi:chorismate mutase|nr:MAG: hypothetical protein EKK64_06370 [Neisseriaceae bacterium]
MANKNIVDSDFSIDENSLAQLRSQITQLDEQIIQLISERQDISRAIGQYKKNNNLPVYDKEREDKLNQFHKKICNSLGVSSSMIENIFNIIIEESRKVQK